MAFPSIVSTSSHGNIFGTEQNPGPIGPFANGTTDRYMILSDQQNSANPANLRAFKSSDSSHAIWAEVDAAHAPAVPADGTGTGPQLWSSFGVCQNGTKLYVIYWGTDFFIHLIQFDMATDTWGTDTGSALTYLAPDRGIDAINDDIICCTYRATDNAVWMMFKTGINDPATGVVRVYGAKILLNTLTWDAALTLLGTADVVTVDEWGPLGMVTRSAGIIDCIYTQDRNDAVDPSTNYSRLIHQVIHTDDSLGVIDTVYASNAGAATVRPNPVSYLSVSSADTLMFTYQVPPFLSAGVHVVRAIGNADNPVWHDEMPAVLQGTRQVLKGTMSLGGLDYIFYAVLDVGFDFYYITSAGIGSPWDTVGTLIGSDATGNAGGNVTGAAFADSTYAITMFWGAL